MSIIYNYEKCIKSFLVVIVIIVFFLCINEHLSAQVRDADGQRPTEIRIAFSDDQSIVIERVLYTAFKRLGCQVIAKISGMRTAVADVNYGDAVILPAQTDGWDLMYPNLIKVPVPIDNVEFTAFNRANNAHHY